MSWLTPITLSGQHVSLVPLATEHTADLIEAAQDGELWKLWYAAVPSPENMVSEIMRRLDLQGLGTLLPFTVINNATGKPCGMTTYCEVNSSFRRMSIGWTWYAQSMQKTAANTEAKLLLLSHAFEQLNCIAIEFRTSTFNHNSRRAIERLGAKFDGIARSYRILPNGVVCDGYVYSIIQSEWAAVKTNLKYRLQQL